jgi:hypothetical protein
MSKIKVPIKNLSKKEFDEAYDDMLASYKDKGFNKYPLPTKEDILNSMINSGEISPVKYIELKD